MHLGVAVSFLTARCVFEVLPFEVSRIRSRVVPAALCAAPDAPVPEPFEDGEMGCAAATGLAGAQSAREGNEARRARRAKPPQSRRADPQAVPG